MQTFRKQIYRIFNETSVVPPPIDCFNYTVSTSSATGELYSYTDCNGVEISDYIGGAGGIDMNSFCALPGSVTHTVNIRLVNNGNCV